MPPRTKLALITRAATRSVAIFAAALVLAGQLAAAAHFHPIADRQGVGAVTQLSADGGLCALCLLAFHSSAAPTAPAVAAPTLAAPAPLAPAPVTFHRIASTSAPTRAPPPAA
jgi:hypothetical protein